MPKISPKIPDLEFLFRGREKKLRKWGKLQREKTLGLHS
jgi:hypothetical protein